MCWPATAPEASAFRAHLRNGWSDITPPTERRPSVTRAPALSAPAAAQAGWKTPPTPQTSSLTTSSSSDSDGCADDSSDGVERVKARLTFSVKPDARLPRAAKQKALAMVATGAGAQDSPTSDPENNAMGGNGMNEGVKAGVRVGGAAKSAGQKAEATQGKGQKAARTGRGKGRCANVADGDQHKQTHRAQGNPGERRRPPTRGQTVTARQLDGAGHLSTRFPAHPDRLHHVRKQAAPKRAAEGEPDVQEYADAVAAAVQGLRRRKRAVVE